MSTTAHRAGSPGGALHPADQVDVVAGAAGEDEVDVLAVELLAAGERADGRLRIAAPPRRRACRAVSKNR